MSHQIKPQFIATGLGALAIYGIGDSPKAAGADVKNADGLADLIRDEE